MKYLKNLVFFFIIIVLVSCNMIHKLSCNKNIACKKHPKILEEKKINFTNNYNNAENYGYEDFPNEDLRYGNILNEDVFNDIVKHRLGKIIDGFKEGKWLSGDAGFDDEGNVEVITSIWREEYFKHGLRDSVFRQFDQNNKIRYETNFKMGTGLWKEFHENGTIYFEIETKDGYFSDTLKLYNSKGALMEKLFYKKDSLVYHKVL